MRWATTVGALTLLAGCNFVWPLAPGGGDEGDAAAPDVARSDGARDRGATADAAADLTVPITVTVSGPDAVIPVGQHLELQLKADVVPSLFRLTAPPCRLKLAGDGTVAGKILKVSTTVDAPGATLVLLASPDAPPGATCTVTSPDPHVTVTSPGWTLGAAQLIDVALVSDYGSKMLKGLRATKLGSLEGTSYPVQAIAWAGGGFSGQWVLARGDDASTGITSSTVRLYRVGGSASMAASVKPWVDLVGQSTAPNAVEDLVWAAVSPCGGSDALLLGADGESTGTVKPGVWCIDASMGITQLSTANAIALDVDPVGGWEPGSGKGTLYISRWGGHYLLPGGTQLDYKAAGLPGNVSGQLRFFQRGELAAVDVSDPTGSGNAVARVSPGPHTSTSLGVPGKVQQLALSNGGPFGELVVVAIRNATWGQFDIVALFNEAGAFRKLTLLENLRCGRVGFDAAGRRMLATIASNQSCNGTVDLYQLELDLP